MLSCIFQLIIYLQATKNTDDTTIKHAVRKVIFHVLMWDSRSWLVERWKYFVSITMFHLSFASPHYSIGGNPVLNRSRSAIKKANSSA